MNFKLDKSGKTLIIHDKLKSNYTLLIIAISLNLINVLLRLPGMIEKGIYDLDYLWLFIGILSILALIRIPVKLNITNEIQIQKIDELAEESTFTGKTKRFLKLKNGKKRELPELKDNQKVEQLKSMLESI